MDQRIITKTVGDEIGILMNFEFIRTELRSHFRLVFFTTESEFRLRSNPNFVLNI